jgi:hypothetical protein
LDDWCTNAITIRPFCMSRAAAVESSPDVGSSSTNMLRWCRAQTHGGDGVEEISPEHVEQAALAGSCC